MTLFWLIASAMLLVALLLIIPAFFFHHRKRMIGRQKQNITIAKQRLEELMAELIRGDISREQYSDARTELEQSLHDDLLGLETKHIEESPRGRWAIPVISVAIPALAVWLYLVLGTPNAIDDIDTQTADTNSSSKPLPSIEEMAQRLKTRLQSEPDNIQGRLMLARTYQAMERYSDAIEILKALYRKTDNPDVSIHYANAIAISRDGQLKGEPIAIINEVLTKYPNHPTGLLLAGMAAAQDNDYRAALIQWQKLQPLLASGSEIRPQLENLIVQAKQRLGTEKTPSSLASIDKSNIAKQSEPSVNVAVSLDSSLAAQIKPTDTLFIYAQALSGPRMPLAVVRRTVEDLPVKTVLTDEQAMMPNMKISNFSEVRIGARISRSGNAIAQSGDLEGTIEPVRVGIEGIVKVVINRKRH